MSRSAGTGSAGTGTGVGGTSSGSGQNNSGSRSSGGGGAGGSAASGARQGGLSARAGAAVAYMSRILGTPCHGVRTADPAVAQGSYSKLMQAQNLLDTWQGDALKMEHFRQQLLALGNQAASALEGAPGPSQSQVDSAIEKLLMEIIKHRPMTVPGSTQVFNPQILPGFDTMSVQQRDEAAAALAEKLKRGEALMKMLTHPSFDPTKVGPPLRQDVSDLAFYLRAVSEKVAGGPWMRGALTIPDPDGKIRQWLDGTSGHVYARPSSHLKGDQKGKGGQGHGMDFETDSMDEGLPYGMRTLLYQSFERDGQGFLYIKMETEGTRVNPYMVWGGKYGKQKGGPEKQDIRPVSPEDVPEAIRHLWNLIVPEKDTSGLARHGEKYGDIPKSVKQAYTSALEATYQHPKVKELLLQGGKFEYGAPKEMEVSQMAANLQELEKLLGDPNANTGLTTGETKEILAAIDAWHEAAKDAWGPDYKDDLFRRVGDEVILDNDDFGPAPLTWART